VAQRRDVRNWVKKKVETRRPVAKPTSAPSGIPSKPSTMKMRKGVETLAVRNSPRRVMESTIMGIFGSGVA
jgi:hypothetical protein